jgi:hypothetical protein
MVDDKPDGTVRLFAQPLGPTILQERIYGHSIEAIHTVLLSDKHHDGIDQFRSLLGNVCLLQTHQFMSYLLVALVQFAEQGVGLLKR